MASIRPLSEDLQRAAIEQLGEVPARINEDLAALKEWIRQQPHLIANTNDQFLLAFLRGCKYSLEKAKAKIDLFFTLKGRHVELCGARDVNDKKFRDIHGMGMFTILPTPLHGNGPRIALLRDGLYPPDKYQVDDLMEVACVIMEILLLEDDYASVNGIVLVQDFEKDTINHLLHWTPTVMKKIIVFLEEAVPFRVGSMHCINTPNVFQQFYNVVKPMLSAKLQDRLFLHGNHMDSLAKYVPLKYLPQEYGGENSSVEEIVRVWDKKLDEHQDYLRQTFTYGSNEKLRMGKAVDFDGLSGIEGSFRKLDVD